MIANEILKAALLGTDKYTPQTSALLVETGEKIAAQTTDKEDRFLKLTIATLLYEEAGRNPVMVENTLPECTPETLSLTTDKLCEQIHTALIGKDEVLFQYLIYIVHKNNQVLASELMPLVLNKALEHKKSSHTLIKVCGETGRWLCGLNEKWRVFFEESGEEDIWETGNFESRKMFLKNTRQTDPEKAVALLEHTINTENAANRLAFLEQLNEQLSLADEPFLQSLSKDKSQKVKETATSFLRKIQGSAINKSYLEYLLSIIQVKEERHLLITKKKVLSIKDDVLPDEALFKTGIDKVSSNKGVPDYIYVAGQMLQDIDPAILATHLAVTEQELIQLLLQHKESKHLLPFLTVAAVVFKNKTWALALLGQPGVSDINLLDALPVAERVRFYSQFIEGQLPQLLTYLFDEHYTILLPSLAGSLLSHLSRNPYMITQPVYQRLALHLPVQISHQLKSYAEDPSQDYQHRYFKTQASEMMRIIDLKNNVYRVYSG